MKDANADGDAGSDASLALDGVYKFGQASVSVNVLGPIASSVLATTGRHCLATRVWHPIALALDNIRPLMVVTNSATLKVFLESIPTGFTGGLMFVQVVFLRFHHGLTGQLLDVSFVAVDCDGSSDFGNEEEEEDDYVGT